MTVYHLKLKLRILCKLSFCSQGEIVALHPAKRTLINMSNVAFCATVGGAQSSPNIAWGMFQAAASGQQILDPLTDKNQIESPVCLIALIKDISNAWRVGILTVSSMLYLRLHFLIKRNQTMPLRQRYQLFCFHPFPWKQF